MKNSNSKFVIESLKKSAGNACSKCLCLLAAIIMLMTGCAPIKVNAATTPSPAPQEIMPVVSNDEQVSEMPTETLDITESPCPTETPFLNPYFVFYPTQEQLEELKSVSLEFNKRFESNYTQDDKCSLGMAGESSAYFIVKGLCGCFDDIEPASFNTEAELAKGKETYYWVFRNFLNIGRL